MIDLQAKADALANLAGRFFRMRHASGHIDRMMDNAMAAGGTIVCDARSNHWSTLDREKFSIESWKMFGAMYGMDESDFCSPREMVRLCAWASRRLRSAAR